MIEKPGLDIRIPGVDGIRIQVFEVEAVVAEVFTYVDYVEHVTCKNSSRVVLPSILTSHAFSWN